MFILVTPRASYMRAPLTSESLLHPLSMTFSRWLAVGLTLLSVLQLTQGHALSTLFARLNLFSPKPAALPDLYEASVLELQRGLDARQFTSVDLVKVRDFNGHYVCI